MNPTTRILFALATIAYAKVQSPDCLDGTLHYENRVIDLPGHCEQVWTSPDGFFIAFAMNTSGGNPPSTKVYWAAKASSFTPVNVPLTALRVRGIDFKSFQFPSLSPGDKRLFFLVPTSATSSTLFSTSLSGRGTKRITEVSDYCVVWNGKLAGSILYSHRGYAPGSYVVRYSCYLRSASGSTSLVSEDCSGSFAAFQRAWEQANHSECPSYYGP